MPCIKVKNKGWRIRKSKGGGLYPKIYGSLTACRKRVNQMEKHKDIKGNKYAKRSL